jgi:hypothetical protein
MSIYIINSHTLLIMQNNGLIPFNIKMSLHELNMNLEIIRKSHCVLSKLTPKQIANIGNSKDIYNFIDFVEKVLYIIEYKNTILW